MKKLSKILVVVLTLAMLLGVVVISASAADKKVDVIGPNGESLLATDSFDEAIAYANEYAEAGDVTVKVNTNVAMTKAIEITRNADLGKVIVDLNGRTLDVSAVSNKYTALGTVLNSSNGAGKVVDYVYVKASADAAAVPYLLETISFDGEIKDVEGNTVLATELIPGETYIGTLTTVAAGSQLNKNHAIPTLTFMRGAFNVGANASLEIDGNFGTIKRGYNAAVFYVGDEADGAELYVRDLNVSNTANAYIVQVNNGVTTLDNVYLYSNDAIGLVRHANSAELNIKNSYLYMRGSSAANGTAIRTQGTNYAEDNPADGYHIEITNTRILSGSYVFSSANTAVSACSSAYAHVQPDGSDKTRKTFYAPHDVPLVGQDCVDTNFLVENCNIEVAVYDKRNRSDNTGLIGYGGFMNFDFKKSDIFVSQKGIYEGLTSPRTNYYNFYDCYFELTGKGNLNNKTRPSFTPSVANSEVNFYRTEFAVSDIYKIYGDTHADTKGGVISPETYFGGSSTYTKINFYAGCIFDGACAPQSAALKARIKGLELDGDGVLDLCTITDSNGKIVKMLVVGLDYKAEVSEDITFVSKQLSDTLAVGRTSNALNPIVVLSGGGTSSSGLTEAGKDATGRQTFSTIDSNQKGWALYTGQGIERVITEADGNKYVSWDPSYVKNDMTGYTYVAAADFAGVTLPDGVTAVGGWDIDGDSVIEYLDTDDNVKDAEYANVARNGAGYSWTEIPDVYTSNVVTPSQPWYTIGQKYFFAPNYKYVTYSFDYRTAEDSDNFIPLSFNVQGRREFSAGTTGVGTDSGTRGFALDRFGNVSISGTKKATLNPDSWNNITVIVEIVEEKVAAGTGALIASGTRGDCVYTNSVAHVFINGEKAGQFVTNFNAGHAYIATLRGIFGSDISAAIAGGAQMCIDNVMNVGYGKDYESAELSALLSGTETKLSSWSDCMVTLYEKYGVTEFPDESEASISVNLSAAAGDWYAHTSTDTIHYQTETTLIPAVVKYASVEEAILAAANKPSSWPAFSAVTLLTDAEKVNITAPATVAKNGFDFTYYSDEYKGTVGENGIVTFTRATGDDFIEVTIDYNDGKGAVTETVILGNYIWLETDRIPTIIKKDLNLSSGSIMQLAYNGAFLEAIDPASYEVQQISAENKSFVFSYAVAEQYGWIILDRNGEFSDLGNDIGYTYEELAARLRVIEAIWNPLANDKDENKKDLPDLVDGGSGKLVPNPALYSFDENTLKLRTNGYTIRLFSDFTNVEQIYVMSSSATKYVNYDLNGHTISYTNGGIYAYGAEFAWIYDKATNNVTKALGSYLSSGMPVNMGVTNMGNGYNTTDYGYVIIQDDFKLYVNIYSSQPGAKMLSTGTNALVKSDRQEHVKFKYTKSTANDTSVTAVSGYTSPCYIFGNAVSASHTDVGPDANVIDVEAPKVFFVGQFASSIQSPKNNVIQNLNIVGGHRDYIINASNDYTLVRNCNVTYTPSAGYGIFNLGTGTLCFEVKDCNIIALTATKLFNDAGGRYSTGEGYYVAINGTRMYNVKIDSRNQPKWSGNAVYNDSYDEAITFGLDCYYNLEFNPTHTTSLTSDKTPQEVKVAPFRFAASRASTAAQYQANVYANETFTINGVDYTFTYKVVADADVVNVQWQDTNGNEIKAAEKYAKGGKLVFGESATRVDALTKAKYVFGIDTVPADYADTTLVVKATEYRYFPAFKVATNLNLETNLKHNIKIWKYVLYNEEYVDITEYIDSVTVGGEKFALAAENLNKGADADSPYDDYYYYTVDVKSNAIASAYDLVINFKTQADVPVEATQSLSVAKYLANGLATADKDSDLYNLYGAIVNYGIASYANFNATAEGDVNELTALAAKYPVADVVIEEAAAGEAAGKIDVEFVLDEQLEYRFKFIDEAMIANWASLTVEISYTDINGDVKTLTNNKTLVKHDGYIDFAVDAFDFAGDVTVRTYLLVNGEATDEYTVTYNIANYYADAKAAGSSETLLTLVEALNAYATYANTYMTNKK